MTAAVAATAAASTAVAAVVTAAAAWQGAHGREHMVDAAHGRHMQPNACPTPLPESASYLGRSKQEGGAAARQAHADCTLTNLCECALRMVQGGASARWACDG